MKFNVTVEPLASVRPKEAYKRYQEVLQRLEYELRDHAMKIQPFIYMEYRTSTNFQDEDDG